MEGRQDGGALSSEQIRRMEENRRKAQERLLNKRAAQGSRTLPPTSSILPGATPVCGPPPAKRPALQPPYRSRDDVHLSTFGPNPINCNTSANVHSSSHFEHIQRNLLTHKRVFDSASHTCKGAPPATSGLPTPSLSTLGAGTTGRDAGLASGGMAAASSSRAAPSSSSSVQMKFTEIQQRIKANLVLVSRSRFKVLVPYNANVIEIFKKIPSKCYDAKTATWSFGVEDYSKLIDVLRKDCKYVDLNLIPRPVIGLFQRLKQGKGPIPHPEMDWSKIDSKLSSTLMQFQREGVEFSVVRGGRVLIADDMGLGKTLQAIAVMALYRSDWPLLVVCPSSVRLTWAEAFKRWLPSLSETDVNVVLSTKLSATCGLVNIISYDLMSKMAKELQEKRFMAVIADESHFLKNYKTARCKAAMPILKAAKRAILLSGTPALSRPIELYTQITALDKNFRSVSLYDFGQRYCNGVKGHFGWDFSGASNMHELQLYMEEAIMIRRFKVDVLDQLPTKRRQMVLLDPTLTKNKDRSDWKAMKEELTRAGKLKALDRKNALLPLFETTGRVKVPAIRDYILDLLEGGRKLIMFAHHKVVLDAVSEAVDGKGYGYIRIDGRTPAELRQTYCDQFQHDEQCLLAILSITTANAGLTLTASSTVVFAELFWNPGILVQAEDRAYRIGQKNSVNIHYLVARDTADDFIWPLIQGKLDVLSQAGLSKDDFSKADSTFMKDSSQLSLYKCFSELISEEELLNIAAFDDESVVTSSSIGCNIKDRDVNVDICASKSKSVTSERVGLVPPMDDDPDFVEATHRREDQVSRPELGMADRKIKSSRKVAGGTETTVPVGEHTQNDHLVPSASRTTTASRLANYLLQHVDSAPALTGKNAHRSCQSQCKEILPVEKEACEAFEEVIDLKPVGDFDAQSLEWFELDSKEDLEDFDKF